MNERINNQRLAPIVIHCPNPNCEYTWIYSGRFSLYATCPSCRKNVKIQENRVKSPRSGKVDPLRQIEAIDQTPVAVNDIE